MNAVISCVVGRCRRILGIARRLRAGARARLPDGGAGPGILDLFEEHVYTGRVTGDGHFEGGTSGPGLARFLGGPIPDGVEPGGFWESRIHGEDWQEYLNFNRRLLRGEDADVRYRLHGVDGATRLLWDRARPRACAGNQVVIDGIISDVTAREDAAARLVEASERFTTLLDVVGEHVYLVLAFPDGTMQELFQGPGADRLLGGAVPDPEMENWDAAVHPDDRPSYERFIAALCRGEDADVEYRLRGADGITRWVHDRAVTRIRPDGIVEVSGIVADVTDRRHLRAELTRAHSALSRVVEATDDHLYTLAVDQGGSWRAVYRGPNRDALMGRPATDDGADEDLWASLIHHEDRGRWGDALALLGRDEEVELEYRVCGVDGRERVVLDSLRPRVEDGTLYFDGVIRDITERRRLENELRRSMAEMQVAHQELEQARSEAELHARTDDLTGAFNRRHFSQVAAKALAENPGACGLLLLDADHFKQVNDAYGHVVGDAVLVEFSRRLQGALDPADCLARWGGEEFAVLLSGVSSDADLLRRAERLREGLAATPVTAEGVSLWLTVSIGAVRDGLHDGLDSLVEAADSCLYAAKGRRNCVSLEPLADEPAPASEPEVVTVARALAFAASIREAIPEAHAQEVAALAALTAEHLGLPVATVLRCRLGGWLHDVGKIAMPAAILDKPGPLDDREWEVMRTHPAIGEAVVRRVSALSDAAAAVRHHHERYDGRGYPDGLAGTAIPIEARIVAAADAYAAMTADRVYSAARTPALAAEELLRSAGTHLDPAVVEALLAGLGLGGRRAAEAA